MNQVITNQTSESYALGILLALSGGLMDAYSYLYRDHVFANAQTGNILLFGIHLAEKNWHTAIEYLFPIAAFICGITLACILRIFLKELQRIHWRQLSLLLEIITLFIVSLIPVSNNLLANSLTSLACGIQAESFRKINGNNIATTMCIGNLRSATQFLCDFLHSKKRQYAYKALLYFSIILFFSLGAILGNMLIHTFQGKAILGSVLLLSISFVLMFKETLQSYIASFCKKNISNIN